MNKSYRMIKLSFLILLFSIIGIAGLSSTNSAYAELTYDEKVEFATIIEEIKGHIIVAVDNKHAENNLMAKMHLTHPIGEYFDDLEKYYKKTNVSSMKLKMVLSLLQSTNTEISEYDFDKLIGQINEVIKKSEMKIVGDVANDDEFKIKVAKNLLETSKVEYITGIEYDSELELQDSYGIAVSANNLISSLEDIEKHQQLKIAKKFIRLYQWHGDNATIEKMSAIIGGIINGLDHINEK